MDDKKFLGIEFGSTRIKAVALDSEYKPVSSGDYTWASSTKTASGLMMFQRSGTDLKPRCRRYRAGKMFVIWGFRV